MLSQREEEDADAGSAAWMQLVGEWRARGSPPENVRREHGRSPGLRVNAYSLGLPGDEPPVTLLREIAHRLQLRSQLRNGRAWRRTGFPLSLDQRSMTVSGHM